VSTIVSKANTIRLLRSINSGTVTRTELWRAYKPLGIDKHLSQLVVHKILEVVNTTYSGVTPINRTYKLTPKGYKKLRFFIDIKDSSLEYAMVLYDDIRRMGGLKEYMPFDKGLNA